MEGQEGSSVWWQFLVLPFSHSQSLMVSYGYLSGTIKQQVLEIEHCKKIEFFWISTVYDSLHVSDFLQLLSDVK